MQIIPDPLFALAMATPFVASLLALNFLLFQPFRAWLDERHAATVGARHDAAALTEQAEQKLVDLEARLAAAREAAGKARADQRAVALAQEQQVLEAARRDAEAQLSTALQGIAADAEAARTSLRGQAAALAADIATQVLGRPVEEGRA